MRGAQSKIGFMKYRILTLIALLVALILGTVVQSLVYASFEPGPMTEAIALVSFIGGVLGGLFGFVGVFRARDGKPFFPKFF